MKSRIAFQFSCDLLKFQNCYLWTFTFRDALDVVHARALWTSAMKALRKQAHFGGIRAFEMHPGGHGLHIHVVTETFYDVNHIRRIWTGAPTDFHGGRVHVVKKPKSAASYIGKYLTKARRPDCLKGARMWACVGGYVGSKVKDIVCDGPLSLAFRAGAALFPGWDKLGYFRKLHLAKLMVANRLREAIGATLIPCPLAI